MNGHMMINNDSFLDSIPFDECDNSIDCGGDYNLDSVPASGCYNQYDCPCEMNARQNLGTSCAGASRIPRAAARPRQSLSPRNNYAFQPVFHERTSKEDDTLLTDTLWKLARKTGTLNLTNKGMARVPERLFNINEADADTKKRTLEQLSINEEDAWWNQVPLNNLDLSSNALTHISPKIENLLTLTVLQLHDNALVELPPQIGKLEKLVRLNLSHNKLKELPPDLYSLPELRHLNISHNEFEELNPDISNLHMLEFLDAGNNNINSLPGGIGFLVRLTALLLANNHIKELPPDIVYMRSLQKLDLMKNDLVALPEDMGLLRKLQFLYVQHNDIKELPNFEGNEMLSELHASNNYIDHVPKELCENLPHLKILDLRDNKITQLPDEVCLLRNLNRLDITNNSISVLPVTLSTLAHLISLQVDGNPIKTIRRDILQCGTARILKTLHDRAQAKERADGGAEDLPCSSSAAGSQLSMQQQQQLPANMTDNSYQQPNCAQSPFMRCHCGCQCQHFMQHQQQHLVQQQPEQQYALYYQQLPEKYEQEQQQQHQPQHKQQQLNQLQFGQANQYAQMIYRNSHGGHYMPGYSGMPVSQLDAFNPYNRCVVQPRWIQTATYTHLSCEFGRPY
ncbi:uncharacterized protein Dmoj_GI24424, isoform D [Drosophila mojavensis]|uniref:Uncharacterized protein, isoform D n=1 Tax=Drosophila mojavensis TaxID=7230 RepID=A0A0Q9WYZ1_DROMO|nr:uncharacterized protein Dmoj_GI24424, isoform D [Drosophila mojavensis]